MSDRYPSIRLEGGLLSAEVIDEVAAGSLPGQQPVDFGFSGSRPFIDEVAPVWAEALAQWKTFRAAVDRLPPDATAARETRDRWMAPLLSLLGYDLYRLPHAAEVDGLSFAFSHRAGPDEDAPPVHIVGCRQSLDRRPESGRPRLGPHSLVQEYLNRMEALWGIATNGRVLRLLRDSHLIRRQSYVEFDLARMMEEERFADFALFIRLLHASRLPRTGDDIEDCLLERYHRTTVEQGGRVRDHLRDGVEKALVTIGDGLLADPANDALRAKAAWGALSPFDYYQQLLKLIYRLLFLAVSEERGLVSDDARYRTHYSISRLRRLAEVRAAYTDQRDLWEGLGTTFRLFGDERAGETLGVPTLGGDLFDPDGITALHGFALSNRALLSAIWDLSMYREKDRAPWRRINYGALDVEELGSVYESLLDFAPVFPLAQGRPSFALSTGTERKSTGSYYTPPELVNELVQSALVPVIADRLSTAATPKEKEQVLLSLSVCDPACGSGHFLLAAARRIGRELARARTGDEEPSPEAQRIAVRDAITHCIYGVDKNPLAVDLCRVALWIEGHSMGRPLTFLDHRIRCGDSLVGVYDLSVLTAGIPDEAYTAVAGDDKAVAREMKRQNKLERSGQTTLSTGEPVDLDSLNASRQCLYTIADDTPANVREKALAYQASQAEGTDWCRDRTACDLWAAAFFAPLATAGLNSRAIPTTWTVRSYLAGDPATVQGEAVHEARRLSRRYRFFHWPLEFPEVFAKGGFDCVLGNPPWEIIELKEPVFFRSYDSAIASAQTGALRKRLIQRLEKDNPDLFSKYMEEQTRIGKTVNSIQSTGRFPLSAHGRFNTYALFAELSNCLLSDKGRSGIIIPTGIATDNNTSILFRDLFENKAIVQLTAFENEEFIFPAVHHAFKFCIFVTTGSETKVSSTDFSFFSRKISDILNLERHFSLSIKELRTINPNTGTCPIFRNKVDADISKKIYLGSPVLINEADGDDGNTWRITFKQGLFNMTSDSQFFRAAEQLEENGFRSEGNRYVKDSDRWMPLYEAKLIHQFDHRFASYENATEANINMGTLPPCDEEEKNDASFTTRPKYWVEYNEIEQCLNSWQNEWLMGWRDIAAAMNFRTSIFSVIERTATAHNFPLIFPSASISEICGLMGNFNSLIFDYCARQKVGGTHVTFLILKQLPVIPPDQYTTDDLAFIVPRVLELTYTAWDIKAFADDIWRDAGDEMRGRLRAEWEANAALTGGHPFQPPAWAEIAEDGCPLAPFVWDEERRAVLRAELDALYGRLYGLTRDEMRYILDPADVYGDEFPGETFRVLKEKEIKKYGEYRTRRLVLEAWDRMLPNYD